MQRSPRGKVKYWENNADGVSLYMRYNEAESDFREGEQSSAAQRRGAQGQ